MATTMDLEMFRYRGSHTHYDSFEGGNGFGPFTVEKNELRKEIVNIGNPFISVHISGCMGAGKTVLLKLIGNDLVEAEKRVYLFKNSNHLDSCQPQIIKMVQEKVQAYFLVDETQANKNSAIFTYLLKNDEDHRITTIGAGVPDFESVSNSFRVKITTNRLFLTSEDLQTEGVVDFFARDVTDPVIRNRIESLLRSIRQYVGGHIYPLMRLSELLVPKLTAEGYSTDQVIGQLNSAGFRNSRPFQLLASRIIPPVADVNIRAVFYPEDYRLGSEILELAKRGFCDSNGKVISMLLFDLYLASIGRTASSFPLNSLGSGLIGVQELLCWGTPRMSWSHYDSHGGAVEDALTFELLKKLIDVAPLKTMLFNPKLVTAGTAARRPDIYFNSSVHSYVECVLTQGNTQSARQDVEKHVLRFVAVDDAQTAHYEIQDADFAVLHFQNWGTVPMQMENEICRQYFDARIFTFLMKTKELYLGNTRIASP